MLKKIILFLILSSLCANGAQYFGEILDDDGCYYDPDTVSQGSGEYFMIDCEHTDTSALAIRIFKNDAENSDIVSLLGNPVVYARSVDMENMNTLDSDIYPAGKFGIETGVNWPVGEYQASYRCSPSLINATCVIHTIEASARSRWCSNDLLKFLGTVLSVGGAHLYCQDVEGEGGETAISILMKLPRFIFTLAVFIYKITFKSIIVWVLGTEAFICVISYYKASSPFDRVTWFFKYNSMVMVQTGTFIIRVSDFALKWTVGVLRQVSPL